MDSCDKHRNDEGVGRTPRPISPLCAARQAYCVAIAEREGEKAKTWAWPAKSLVFAREGKNYKSRIMLNGNFTCKREGRPPLL
ncbi:hypothetical protein SU32_10700 [Ahrensia marina]|uniref:Uncharacterized protein n=1 Tax=Ahrensia marina TaxID=1514904 RepID=A0A0M9GMA8_9HYPH|nr:hypothetical protein SU32_10700 [Ahrensia marina]